MHRKKLDANYLTQVLTMGSFISLYIQERKAIIDVDRSLWALWCICCLTVARDEESMGNRGGSRGTWRSLQSIWSWRTIQSTGTYLYGIIGIQD